MTADVQMIKNGILSALWVPVVNAPRAAKYVDCRDRVGSGNGRLQQMTQVAVATDELITGKDRPWEEPQNMRLCAALCGCCEGMIKLAAPMVPPSALIFDKSIWDDASTVESAVIGSNRLFAAKTDFGQERRGSHT